MSILSMEVQSEYDVIVVGTGAAGMSSAIVAANEGLKVLIVEKEAFFGGTSAISGGGLWIPNTKQQQARGIKDSLDDAVNYLEQTVGAQTSKKKQRTFLEKGAEMIEYMEANTELKLQPYDCYPDYYPKLPGGLNDGRGLEAEEINARALGDDFFKLKPPLPMCLLMGGMLVGKSDIMNMQNCATSWPAFKYTVKRFWDYFKDVKGRKYYGRGTSLNSGNALIARLFVSLSNLSVPLKLNAKVTKLLQNNDAISGVTVIIDGQEKTIKAKKGVVLACGGFPGSSTLRQEYFPQPSTPLWTAAPQTNTGDGIIMGRNINAKLAGMKNAWWMPVSLLDNKEGQVQQYPHVIDRAKPGVIVINNKGKRFVNEAVSYLDFVKAMYKDNDEKSAIPSFMIGDSDVVNKFGLGFALPMISSKKELIKKGYLFKSDTIADLADKLGIDANGLEQTIASYNQDAEKGIDTEFSKGENEYDTHFGAKTKYPNPCMAPLKKGPFYGIKIYPGDIGTSGGLQTNEFSQVLDIDDKPITGLYAAGNDSASVMGDTYPGPGSTLGPALTFGYIAGRHLAKQ